MYLVLIRCSMDDIPLRLCPTEEAARSVCGSFDWRAETNNAARQVLGLEVGTLHSLGFVRFDSQGVPQLFVPVRYFDQRHDIPHPFPDDHAEEFEDVADGPLWTPPGGATKPPA